MSFNENENTSSYLLWMNEALKEARKAFDKNEVPIGALIIHNNQIISRAHNIREKIQSPLGHAEVLAIHQAAKKLQSWRLEKCVLVITLEPCLMCCGSILQARIPQIVFGAADPKAGAVSSLYNTLNDSRLNHQTKWFGGVKENECSELLKKFFKKIRSEKKKSVKLLIK